MADADDDDRPTSGGSEADDDDEMATVLRHPTAVPFEAFDEMPDLTDRRRLLLKLVFGVDVEDPDPVFDP